MENKFLDGKCKCDLFVKLLFCACLPVFLFFGCSFISEPEPEPADSFIESAEDLS